MLSKKRTSPFSHLNWMLSSSMICPHLFTKFSGISVPSANVAELDSLPCMPTTMLNHILLPFLPSNTFVNDRGPIIVFTLSLGSHSMSIPRALALSHIFYDRVPSLLHKTVSFGNLLRK
ncbi:hypothetical protein NC651_024666 [Populus alba x Populus x berolinensis]|nr:hypothetical protein NC651_024666 [Populus alba x Populus x berolinensis]